MGYHHDEKKRDWWEEAGKYCRGSTLNILGKEEKNFSKGGAAKSFQENDISELLLPHRQERKLNN